MQVNRGKYFSKLRPVSGLSGWLNVKDSNATELFVSNGFANLPSFRACFQSHGENKKRG